MKSTGILITILFTLAFPILASANPNSFTASDCKAMIKTLNQTFKSNWKDSSSIADTKYKNQEFRGSIACHTAHCGSLNPRLSYSHVVNNNSGVFCFYIIGNKYVQGNQGSQNPSTLEMSSTF